MFLSKLCHMIKGSLLVVMTTDIYISKNWGRTLLFGMGFVVNFIVMER